MLSSKLILSFILTIILGLQACGFSPVYGKHSQISNARIAITNLDIQVGRTQLDNTFKQTLEDTLNPTHEKGSSRYIFKANLKVSSSYLAILQNSNITSYQVSIIVNYTLTDNITHKAIRTASITRQANFDRSRSEYSTFVSEQKAKENLVKSLAQDLSLIITSSILGQEKKNSSSLHIDSSQLGMWVLDWQGLLPECTI